MKRPTYVGTMPCVLSLMLTLFLVSCGGGDTDGDDGSGESGSPTVLATHTGTVALPTDAPAPATASPTEMASPTIRAPATGDSSSGSGSGSGSGTGGSAPLPTGGAASPTATERPRNVSTTPRPIATRPPEPTPTAENVSDLVVVYEDNFDDGDAGALYVGTTDTGATAGVADGAYVASAPADFWQSFSVGGTEAVTNGVMWATVSLTGTGGAAGLVARQYNTEDGGYWLVTCWIDTDGSAGCHENRSNEFTEILAVEAGTIALQPANALVLSLADGGLYFEVNDQEVGVATVSDLTPGNWGLYVETYAGAENTVYFDDITVWDAGS